MSTFTSADLIYASDDALKGLEIVFRSGDEAGVARIITGFTASSDTVTVTPDYDTGPAEADPFDLYDPRIADKEMLDLWIRLAVESVIDEYSSPWEDEVSLIGQAVGANLGLEDWSSGAALAPDNWTCLDSGSGGGIAQSLLRRRGKYSALVDRCSLVQCGTDLIVPFPELLGHTVTFSVWVYAEDAAAVTSAISDGVAYDTDGPNTAVGWQQQTCSLAIDTTAPAGNFLYGISVAVPYYAIMAEPTLTVAGHAVYEYYLPKKFGAINRMVRDNGDNYAFYEEIPARYYDIDFATSRVVFNKAYYTPVSGAHYKLFGERYPEIPDADSDEIIVPLDYIVAYCRMCYLKLRQPANVSATYYASAEVERMKRRLPRRPRVNRRMAR